MYFTFFIQMGRQVDDRQIERQIDNQIDTKERKKERKKDRQIDRARGIESFAENLDNRYQLS